MYLKEGSIYIGVNGQREVIRYGNGFRPISYSETLLKISQLKVKTWRKWHSRRYEDFKILRGRILEFRNDFKIFCLNEGPTLETLDFTIRIGSTPNFLYFDLYISTLPIRSTLELRWLNIGRCISNWPYDVGHFSQHAKPKRKCG